MLNALQMESVTAQRNKELTKKKRINMEMIKVVKWAVTGFTACPKLNSKNISGKKFLCINIQEVNTGMQ